MLKEAHPVNVAIVISSLGSGGAERVAVEIANKLCEFGKNVTVITLSSKINDFYILADKVKRIKLSVDESGDKRKIRNKLRVLSLIRQQIKISNTHIVISFMPETNIKVLSSLVFTKIPIIVTEHSDPKRLKKKKIWSILRVVTYPFAARIVSVSKGIDNYFSWINKGKRSIIHNPLTTINNSVNKVSNDLDNVKTTKTIISMGRLQYIKGFDILINAFSQIAKKHPEWSLVILGEGPERFKLTEKIKKLKIEERVYLPGNIQNPFPLLKSADVFAFSSRSEGFGNVIIEAMACNLPVVCMESMGPSEIIEHNYNGILVEKEKDFAIALESLINNQAKQQRIIENAKQELWKYNTSYITKLWEKEIEKVLSKKNN